MKPEWPSCRKKEELEGYHIDDDIITYIATNIKSNIRELEGAFNRLIALSTLEKRPIDMLLAEEAIKDIISPGESRKVTPELIIEIVAEHFHITPADIYSNKRTANIAYPRQVAMYLCKENGTTLKKIGDIMGGRDHTTVNARLWKRSKKSCRTTIPPSVPSEPSERKLTQTRGDDLFIFHCGQVC